MGLHPPLGERAIRLRCNAIRMGQSQAEWSWSPRQGSRLHWLSLSCYSGESFLTGECPT